jgi:hypothetical protein
MSVCPEYRYSPDAWGICSLTCGQGVQATLWPPSASFRCQCLRAVCWLLGTIARSLCDWPKQYGGRLLILPGCRQAQGRTEVRSPSVRGCACPNTNSDSDTDAATRDITIECYVTDLDWYAFSRQSQPPGCNHHLIC